MCGEFMALSGCVSLGLQFEEMQKLLVALLLPALLSQAGGLRAVSSRGRPAAFCRGSVEGVKKKKKLDLIRT